MVKTAVFVIISFVIIGCGENQEAGTGQPLHQDKAPQVRQELTEKERVEQPEEPQESTYASNKQPEEGSEDIAKIVLSINKGGDIFIGDIPFSTEKFLVTVENACDGKSLTASKNG